MNDSVCREGNQQLSEVFSICELSKVHSIIKRQEYDLFDLTKVPDPNRPILARSHYILIGFRDVEVRDEVSVAHEGGLQLSRVCLPYFNLATIY